MATFTIDLLTGNPYLFSGDFSGSGSTPTTGSTYPQVNLYSELPSPASASGQIYVVRSGSGSYVLNRKPSGFYFSTGTVWRFLGETPDFFKSNNFQIYDSVDTTKGVMFTISGISTNTFRKLIIQNSDGTIAYLTDLDTKVNITAFADYTGTTAPATYLTKTAFNTFTGTTLPLNYYNKTQINSYTGETNTRIDSKASLSGDIFTGAVYGPTAIIDSNTTQLATTAFVVGQAGTMNPLMDGIATIGTSLRYSRQDHVHPSDTSRLATTGGIITGSLTINSNLNVLSGITGNTLYVNGTLPSATIQQPTLFWNSTTKQIEARQLTGGSDQYFYDEIIINRTTTSTTCVKAHGLSGVTLAGRYEVTFSAEFGQATTNACVLGAFKIDNVTQGSNILIRTPVANFNNFNTFTRDVTLTNALHCFEIYYWNAGGTACVPISTIRVKRIS